MCWWIMEYHLFAIPLTVTKETYKTEVPESVLCFIFVHYYSLACFLPAVIWTLFLLHLSRSTE